MLKLIAVLLVLFSTNAAENPLHNGTNTTNEDYDVITDSSGFDVTQKNHDVTKQLEENIKSLPIQSASNAKNNMTLKQEKHLTTSSNDVTISSKDVTGTKTANMTSNKKQSNKSLDNTTDSKETFTQNNIVQAGINTTYNQEKHFKTMGNKVAQINNISTLTNNTGKNNFTKVNKIESSEFFTEQSKTSQKVKLLNFDMLETYIDELTLNDVNVQVLHSNGTAPELLTSALQRAFSDFYLKNANLKNLKKKITFKEVDCRSNINPFSFSDVVAMYKMATLVVGPVCDRPYQPLGLLEKFPSVVVVPGDQVKLFFN